MCFCIESFYLFCLEYVGRVMLAGVLHKHSDVFLDLGLTVFAICTHKGDRHDCIALLSSNHVVVWRSFLVMELLDECKQLTVELFFVKKICDI